MAKDVIHTQFNRETYLCRVFKIVGTERGYLTANLWNFSGLQDLESQLFTASDIPLQMLDFSSNLLRRITDKVGYRQ